jgi:hypothetical protein
MDLTALPRSDKMLNECHGASYSFPIDSEVSSLLEYMKIRMFFSKKTFSAFLKFGGYTQQDILIHKARARVRKYLI